MLPRPIRRAVHLLPVLSLVAGGLIGTANAADIAIYFRSDGGVPPEAGSLPERLDEPGAVRWRTALDPGHSTPIAVDGRLFLTTFRRSSNELATVALNEETGEIVWRRAVSVPRVEQTHALGSPATATVASDGSRVFSFFGSYGLRCHSLDGTLLWERRMGPFQDEYGAGSSPIVVDGKVILNQDHDVDSFLAAFDAQTGAELWRTSRPIAVRSYSTPAVWSHDGRKDLLVAGALELTTYDSQSGAKLWAMPGLARIVIPTPIPEGDRLYVASWAPGGDTSRRIELVEWPAALANWDGNHDGRLTRDEVKDPQVLDRFYRMDLDQDTYLNEEEWIRHAEVFRRAQNAMLAIDPGEAAKEHGDPILWKHTRGVPYVASPLLHNDLLWMVKDGGIVTKLQAADGRLVQEERVPGIGSYFSSPVSGDGKVYFASEPGVVSVVAEKTEWQVLSSHKMGEPVYATPLLHRGRVFIRTEAALYAFGQNPAARSQTPAADSGGGLRVARFDLDVTPPIGFHMAYDPVTNTWDLGLRARGIVLLGAGEPIVLAALDWIGIGNEGHDAFREALAEAAGTSIHRVAVHTLHQHDAPDCDFGAERILKKAGVDPLSYDGDFARDVLRRMSAAVRDGLKHPEPVTHLGLGKAEVFKVASTRRILGADGRVRAVRYTACPDPALRAEPEGTIDPEVSLVSLWNGDQPVVVLSYYAVHPQSYYRTGIPNPDFPGVARFLRQLAVPEALHIHFNGAGGNLGAGKYNDGSKVNRLLLAERLADGMRRAWDATTRTPIQPSDVDWTIEPVSLPPSRHLSEETLRGRMLARDAAFFLTGGAAKLAWLHRCQAGHKIDVSCLRLGTARILHLPGELFVEYQLAAKAERPDLFVAMAAYGDYGPGYIGTAVAYDEGGYETSPDSSNVAPEVEPVLLGAIHHLLEAR